MSKQYKFKEGQKVRLVDNRDKIVGKIACGWNDCMDKHFGEVVTVKELRTTYTGKMDYALVEENIWSWDLRLLEPVEEKQGSKVYGGYMFSEEDWILPCDYHLKKVIENGNAVICFVENEETGKTIKTVAICQEGDTFDLHKGIEICMYKTLRKIADKNLKRF